MTRTIITCPEIWMPVTGFEGYYEVSILGRVKNSRRGSLIKSHPDKDGYLRVRFFIHNTKTKHSIHRLVANAFIPKHSPELQVNHIDGDKFNNAAPNLEWVTSRQNIHHAVDIGLRNHKGSANHFSSLNEAQVAEIKKKIQDGIKYRAIAQFYNVKTSCISKIKLNHTWQHVQ